MKEIKIKVTVKYIVDAEMTVSDEEFESLKYMSRDHVPTKEFDLEKYVAGSKLLAANIHERDRTFRSYQIDSLEKIADVPETEHREKPKSKPFRKWRVTAKEVSCELPIHTELHGPFDIDDVKDHFGLEGNDVEWYNIEEIKNE